MSCITDYEIIKNRANGLSEQNLTTVVGILQKIVNLNILDKNLDILGPANNILDPRNAFSWRTMNVSFVAQESQIICGNVGRKTRLS